MVENLQLDRTLAGYFTPGAQMILTSQLRMSGLLHNLQPEDLKTLLFVLTFLTPNGLCQPSIQEVAKAMEVSLPKAQNRIQRLAAIVWQGKALVVEIKRPSGLESVSPSADVVGTMPAGFTRRLQPLQEQSFTRPD
jgi:hypothetical protein